MNSNSDKNEKLVENKCSDALVKSENSLTSDARSDIVSKEIAGKVLEDDSSIGNKSNNSHSRQSSDTCQTSSSSLCDNRNGDIGNCVQGSIVGLHRKMVSNFYINDRNRVKCNYTYLMLEWSEFYRAIHFFRCHKRHTFYRLKNIVLFCLDCP